MVQWFGVVQRIRPKDAAWVLWILQSPSSLRGGSMAGKPVALLQMGGVGAQSKCPSLVVCIVLLKLLLEGTMSLHNEMLRVT